MGSGIIHIRTRRQYGTNTYYKDKFRLEKQRVYYTKLLSFVDSSRLPRIKKKITHIENQLYALENPRKKLVGIFELQALGRLGVKS
jgi:hypothetical protein